MNNAIDLTHQRFMVQGESEVGTTVYYMWTPNGPNSTVFDSDGDITGNLVNAFDMLDNAITIGMVNPRIVRARINESDHLRMLAALGTGKHLNFNWMPTDITSWDYRIVRSRETDGRTTYASHQAFYKSSGELAAIAEYPEGNSGDQTSTTEEWNRRYNVDGQDMPIIESAYAPWKV